MSIYSGTVTTGSDDWYYDSQSMSNVYTSSTITAKAVNTMIQIYAYGTSNITTSGISSAWTINGATFHWYDVSYTKSKDATYNGSISILDSGGTGIQIYSFTTLPSVGWKSHALISSELQYINNSVAAGKTMFQFLVDDDATYDRTWVIGACEGSSRSAYLVVDYSSPSTVDNRRRTIVIG